MESPAFKQLQYENNRVPASPEMKSARNRLGSLLSGIRESPSKPFLPDVSDPSASVIKSRAVRNLNEPGGYLSSSAPSNTSLDDNQPTVTVRAKKVLFELRNKPFELQDRGREQSLYELCRLWVKGHDNVFDDSLDPKHIYPPPDDSQLDLLATKEIHALPARSSDPALVPPLDAPRYKPENSESAASDPAVVLAQYTQHWRHVKRRHVDHARLRTQPYEKSLHLLKTVYDINQQNQQLL